jgi:ferredoxin
MEGTGPSAGKPVRTDLLMVGTNPYEIDIVAALIMGFEPLKCPLLQKAVETNRISQSFIDEIKSAELPVACKSFERPDPAFLAKLVVMPGLKNAVRKLRNTRAVSSLLKLTSVRRIMFLAGLTQEVIISQERNIKLKFHKEKCIMCGKCGYYCPQMLELPEALERKESDCINCLYCYAVCPADAIEAEGRFGYYSEQIRRYGKLIKEIA